MSATLNRLWCALFRHAPGRLVERVGEWTIYECPRCQEWWATPSTWWTLRHDAALAGKKLTSIEAAMLKSYAAEVDAELESATLDNRQKGR
jgi:hypothetical protein